ncbi:MAG: phosphate acyltransferase PlsX [Oscillospiraceae bacterium]
MKIVIDAFGGDNAPLEIIKGVVLAKEYGEQLILSGSEKQIKCCAADNGIDISGIEIFDAQSVMDMHDEAKSVLKAKSDSSMAVGMHAVADGKADAFVTAGPTGATLMGATMIVKRIKGVKRPSLCAVIPSAKNPFLLIDCGANTECRPEMLDQFGVMGSVYMSRVMNCENPRVGLANNGAEDSKGTELQVEAYKLMRDNKDMNFVGNAEGRDIPLGDFDVIVADGFTGNIILKLTEGLAGAMFQMLKGVFYKNTISKLAAMALKPGLREFKNAMDYSKYGGAPIIGLQKPVVKAHGSSNAEAVKNAVRQAITWSKSGVTEALAEKLGK